MVENVEAIHLPPSFKISKLRAKHLVAQGYNIGLPYTTKKENILRPDEKHINEKVFLFFVTYRKQEALCKNLHSTVYTYLK